MRKVLLSFVLALGLAAGASAKQEEATAVGKVIVRVRELGGANISTPAWVRLYSDISMFQLTSGTQDSAQIVFENVPLGEYHIEVRAPGYLQAVNDASLMSPNAISHVWVELRLEKGPHSPAAASSRAGPPVMAPKARKELELAGAALRSNDLKKAQSHLDRAKALAPGHPDVHYLQGLIYFHSQDNAAARKSLETAINLYPAHPGALASLGATLYRLGDFSAGVAALDKAVELSPQNWLAHRSLAMCHIRLRTYDKARAHVDRAIEIAGDKAPELHVLLARVLIVLNQKEKARAELQAFLISSPGHPEAKEAQRLLTRLLGDMDVSGGAQPEAAAGPSAANTAGIDAALANVRVSAEFTEVRSVAGRWTPPTVDDKPPLLLKNASCKLSEVLEGTGKRAVALVKNLERVSATEKVQQAELDADGNQLQLHTNVFRYLVSITEPRSGNLWVEELRDVVSRSAVPPRYLTNGLGALALIFHPYYVKDFDMHCEGLSEMQGQAAWSVYFKQRADKPSRIYTYTLSQEGSFGIPLKGRAWIAANNFQVLRLETDLVEPVKRLRLEQEHLSIEYQPVDFKSRKVRLWLPANAERYAFFRGHRFLHQHTFTDFQVFSVDVLHKAGEPKNP